MPHEENHRIMRPMTICPECYACLKRLMTGTVELASPIPDMRRRALLAASSILDQEFSWGTVPARIANRFLLAIHTITGNADPFAERKATETAFAARMVQNLLPGYDDNLDSLLRLAALGNALDFFRGQAEVSREMEAVAELGIFQVSAFRRELAGPPGLLLYLADNAGEQFFDRPLVSFLRRQGWQVLYVVKGGPIQNDLTREDLEASGLKALLEPVVDTGACTVGLDLSQTSAEFRKLHETARIIVAKGMGHFETMSHGGDPRVWFLLQAKCIPVAQSLGVERNTLVLARASAISLDNCGQAV
jgi:damage-control phosphatase, subfamily I